MSIDDAQLSLTGIAARRRVTLEEIVAVYATTRSIWKTGRELGISGQMVHERLRAAGERFTNRRWTEDEDTELVTLLEAGLTAGQCADRLGRTFAAVGCRMNEKGLYVRRAPREVKVPRGAGYDKASIGKHLTAIERSGALATRYCRSNALSIESFVQSCQRHFPDRWAAYVAAHSDIPTRICPYCERVFIPANGKQTHCSRKCGADARRDASYFGGNRRATVGLMEGVCQLCGRENVKGLSSHHVYGKENDPDNLTLIALCQGCHKTVGLLASRTFVDNPETWETLISLVWLRKHGPEIAAGTTTGDTLYAYVEIETYDDDEEESV